jgi:hypothetical protein
MVKQNHAKMVPKQSKMAPEYSPGAPPMGQEASKWRKRRPDGFNEAPRVRQDMSRWLQDVPRWLIWPLAWPQEGSRWLQRNPRWPHDGSKMAPRGLKRGQVEHENDPNTATRWFLKNLQFSLYFSLKMTTQQLQMVAWRGLRGSNYSMISMMKVRRTSTGLIQRDRSQKWSPHRQLRVTRHWSRLGKGALSYLSPLGPNVWNTAWGFRMQAKRRPDAAKRRL